LNYLYFGVLQVNRIDELSLALEDLNIEDLLPVELNEEAMGHPENLASTKWCCCCISSLPT